MLIQRLVMAVSLLCLIGCGGGPANSRVDVSGTVTMDGAPLADAEVKFLGEKVNGFGKTNAEGKFQLVQGVDPGTYKVIVSKLDGKKEPVSAIPEGMDAGQMEAAAAAAATDPRSKIKATAGPKELIPPMYSDPGATELKFTVEAAGTTAADFKITSM